MRPWGHLHWPRHTAGNCSQRMPGQRGRPHGSSEPLDKRPASWRSGPQTACRQTHLRDWQLGSARIRPQRPSTPCSVKLLANPATPRSYHRSATCCWEMTSAFSDEHDAKNSTAAAASHVHRRRLELWATRIKPAWRSRQAANLGLVTGRPARKSRGRRPLPDGLHLPR